VCCYFVLPFWWIKMYINVRAARGSLKIQDAKNDAKNRHLGTIPQLYRAISSQLRHLSTIGKKLIKQQHLLHMSSQYGELRPTSGWDRFGSLGHPSYFQRLPRLGSVTAQHVVVGVSQTLRRWTEGATYVWQGDHHVGHWPTVLVCRHVSRYFCSINPKRCEAQLKW